MTASVTGAELRSCLCFGCGAAPPQEAVEVDYDDPYLRLDFPSAQMLPPPCVSVLDVAFGYTDDQPLYAARERPLPIFPPPPFLGSFSRSRSFLTTKSLSQLCPKSVPNLGQICPKSVPNLSQISGAQLRAGHGQQSGHRGAQRGGEEHFPQAGARAPISLVLSPFELLNYQRDE